MTARALLDATITEAAWQRTVIDAARYLGWACFHTAFSLGSQPGYPDLTLFHPVHGALWVELKTETGRATANQLEWGRVIEGAGCRWMICRPSDWETLERALKGES